MGLMDGGMRAQGEVYRQTLVSMAHQMDELDVDEATASEEAVCRLLVEDGFMEVVGFDEDMERCPVERAEWCEYRLRGD